MRYLALLFRGAVEVYENDWPAARRAFEAALAIGPACQTPYLALSYVEQMTGQEARARELVDTFASQSNDPFPDPWWDYQNGGVDQEALGWLRARISR